MNYYFMYVFLIRCGYDYKYLDTLSFREINDLFYKMRCYYAKKFEKA